MREHLIQYVELLFAAAPNSTEAKQEILQNTLDRFDDLISQGKTPEAAYQLAIAGIGDINEILNDPVAEASVYNPSYTPSSAPQEDSGKVQNRNHRAIAIALYILCPIPLFILSEFGLSTLGLCLTLALVAVATYVIMLGKKNEPNTSDDAGYSGSTLSPIKRRISVLTRSVALVFFLLLSFLTGAWYITWLVFPIAGCIRGLFFAIIDLKEANDYEN